MTVKEGETSTEIIFEEFEKRLVGSPSSSLLWIKYMSSVLKLVSLTKARAIAERALQTINFREELEKMNIWVAYLNLEHLYGSAETLKKVFDRSLVYCEPRTMYMQLAKIYVQTEKREEALATFQALIKKFSQSCKVWLAYGEYLYERDIGGGRKLLATALKSLPRRKHEKITMKFAQLEYRMGSAERARTLFEGILANSPKRIDILSVYVTMEENRCKREAETNADTKLALKEYIRRLYERILAMKLSSKKAKFFFKRYLEFEKRHGSESTVVHVKDLVRRYVESSTSLQN